MLARLRRSSLAVLVAVLAWTGSVQAAGTIRITEVMSNALTLGSMDWWEITNYGDTAVDLTGWKMDDNSYSLAAAVSLVPYASGTEPAWSLVNPGESVVFMETASPSTAVPAFQSFWNLGSGTGNIRNPKLGSYTGSGIGLSSAGDGVCLFDSTGVEVTRVAFGAATTGCSFYWSYDSAGVLGSAPAGTVSTAPLNNAYTVAPSGTSNTGSPGIAVTLAPVVSLYWTANGSALGGSGTWNSSSNRWSPSDTTVSGGPWANGRAAYFAGTSGTVTVDAAVAPLSLNFTTSGYTLASGSGSIAAADVSVVGGGVATIATRLTGSSGLSLGGGTLLLAGTANDYSGFTNVVGGTLQLAANNVIPDVSRIAVSRFMLADFNGKSDTVGGLQGLGSVKMGPTVTVNITGTTDARLDGFLSGTGDLVIDSVGSGVQRLNTSAQTLNQDFAVKDYVGKTTVKRGALGVDRSAVPLNTTEVTVQSGGRLALSPNAAAQDQIFTFGSNPALPVTLASGTIGQGAGDDVELANELAVSGTATVQIVNKNNPDPLVPSTQQFTFSGPLTGSGVLRVVASDTTSGLAQSRAKFTASTGNTFAGTVSPGPYAVARFNGDFTQTSVALAGGKVDGYGAIKTVSGTGIVSPDGTAGPDGIFTVGSLAPVGGMSFNFDFTAAATAPVWSTPTQSVNDVLRLTGTVPFATSLASANVVRLFVSTTALSAGDWFEGGFFTVANQTSAITGGAYETYVLGDGQGTDIEHSGLRYYTLANFNQKAGTSLAPTVTMVSTTASFDGSTATAGWIMRTNFAAAPSVITITVASGTQTQAQAGYPTLSGATPVVKAGAGTLVLTTANTLTGSTTVQAGVLRLADSSALSASRLVVVAGGTGQVAPFMTTGVAGLDLATGNGLVDVTSGAMTIAGGMTAVQLVAELIEGRGDGSWTGSSGITSSSAAAAVASSVPRAVGWIDNGDGSVTAAFAAPGDTNLDWAIDILDAGNFLAGGKFDTGLPASWVEGDFSYDGIVDILDAADFFATGLYDAGNYNVSPAAAGAVAAVPEPVIPGSLLLAAAIAATLRRQARLRGCRVG